MGLFNDITDRQETSLHFLSTQNPDDYIVGYKYKAKEEDVNQAVYASNLTKKGFEDSDEWVYDCKIATKISVLIRELENQSIGWIFYHDITYFEVVSKSQLTEEIKIVIN
ncbi:MAG TPA: hypothetical protein DCS93_13805 [Microscillaceae bacterium]|nr:hypothetical protein [Microscillaceae bacterium]